MSPLERLSALFVITSVMALAAITTHHRWPERMAQEIATPESNSPCPWTWEKTSRRIVTQSQTLVVWQGKSCDGQEVRPIALREGQTP